VNLKVVELNFLLWSGRFSEDRRLSRPQKGSTLTQKSTIGIGYSVAAQMFFRANQISLLLQRGSLWVLASSCSFQVDGKSLTSESNAGARVRCWNVLPEGCIFLAGMEAGGGGGFPWNFTVPHLGLPWNLALAHSTALEMTSAILDGILCLKKGAGHSTATFF
jgi:hypothetical protein